MVQATVVIEDGTMPTVRADINNTILALANQQLGPTQPPSIQPESFWQDEDDDSLRLVSPDASTIPIWTEDGAANVPNWVVEGLSLDPSVFAFLDDTLELSSREQYNEFTASIGTNGTFPLASFTGNTGVITFNGNNLTNLPLTQPGTKVILTYTDSGKLIHSSDFLFISAAEDISVVPGDVTVLAQITATQWAVVHHQPINIPASPIIALILSGLVQPNGSNDTNLTNFPNDAAATVVEFVNLTEPLSVIFEQDGVVGFTNTGYNHIQVRETNFSKTGGSDSVRGDLLPSIPNVTDGGSVTSISYQGSVMVFNMEEVGQPAMVVAEFAGISTIGATTQVETFRSTVTCSDVNDVGQLRFVTNTGGQLAAGTEVRQYNYRTA